MPGKFQMIRSLMVRIDVVRNKMTIVMVLLVTCCSVSYCMADTIFDGGSIAGSFVPISPSFRSSK